MADPLYKFVTGTGDSSHQHNINEAARQGYDVVQMTLDAEQRGENKQLIVLMRLRPKPAQLH